MDVVYADYATRQTGGVVLIDDAALDALEKLALAATPGPWTQTHFQCGDGDIQFEYFSLSGSGGFAIVEGTGDFGAPYGGNPNDPPYIAAASPDMVLALIRRIRELQS